MQEAPVNQPKSSLKISDSQAQLRNLFTQRTNQLHELQRSRSARSGETRKDTSTSQRQQVQSPTEHVQPETQEFELGTLQDLGKENDMYGKKLMESHGPILNTYIREFNKEFYQNDANSQTEEAPGTTTNNGHNQINFASGNGKEGQE